MYQIERIEITKNKAYKYILTRGGNQIRYAKFLTLLQQEQSFRSFFIESLANIPLRAYHWETPAVTVSTTDQPFEFVATRSPGIDLQPDPGPFRQYFSNTGTNGVAVFNNLGNDAKLIAPEPVDGQEDHNYSHIAVFTEEAPIEQQHKLWKRVGRVTEKQLSEQPLWLNTAGGGVAWLHVRLDSRPKYYLHQPYTT